MKRKIFCLILASCCFTAAGCNRVEKESPPDSVVNSSTNLPDSLDSDTNTYGSSNDQSTVSNNSSDSTSVFSTSSIEKASTASSTDQSAASSSITDDYRSPNSPGSLISSSSANKPPSSSIQSSNHQSSVTQSSKPQTTATQSSAPGSTVTQTSSSVPTANSSWPNKLIPPENVTIVRDYDRRSPEQWEIEFADEVFELTNAERAKEGLPALKRMELLDNAVNIRAWEVLVNYGHTRPDGRKFSTAITEAGIKFKECGENIAAGNKTPQDVITAWMNSSKHRANILNPEYEYLGVGFYYDYDGSNSNGYRYFWVQNFCTEL